MARRRRLDGVLRWVLPALAVEALSPVARAEEPLRAVLEYEAPEDCPSQAEFEHHIAQRTRRLRFVTDASAGRYKVVLSRNAKGSFTGRLSGGAAAPKIELIQGQACADVAAALSLNLALLVDPDAVLDVPPQAPEPEPPPARKEEPGPMPIAPPRPQRWLILAEWLLRGALGQVASVGGGLAGEYWGNRYGAFAPVARLEVTYSLSTREVNGADVTFQLLQVAPSFCPLRVGTSTVRWLPLCGGAELGTIQVSSEGLIRTALTRRVWTAGKATTALAIVGAKGAVEIAGGVIVPFRRYDFVFEDPTVLVYATPRAGAFASVSVGIPF